MKIKRILSLTFILFITTLTTSCLKEEFLKTCSDTVSVGCLSLDQTVQESAKTINVTSTSASATETTGSVTLTLEISDPHEVDVLIPFYTSGTFSYLGGADFTISGTDVFFDDTNGQGTVTIPKGYSSRSIIIVINDDALGEDTEDLHIQLGVPTNASLGNYYAYDLSVTDNDTDPTVEFDLAASTVDESVGTTYIKVNLSAPSGKDIHLAIDSGSGTASPGGVDYNSISPLFVIPAGSTEFEIPVYIKPDTALETDETIVLEIKNTTTNATLDPEVFHTITIEDNDLKPLINFANTFLVYNESIGTVTLTVELDKTTETDVDFDYTISGTTVGGGVDHDLADGSGTISTGNTSTTIVFNVTDDALPEVDETVIVTITDPGGAANFVRGTGYTSTVLIQDNESNPEVTFRYSGQRAFETSSNIEIILELSGISGSDVQIPYTVSGDAVNPTHHSLADGIATITAGNLTTTINVNLGDDGEHGTNKTLVVTMGVPTGAVVGDITSHTVTILDPKFVTLPNENGSFVSLPFAKVPSIFVEPASPYTIHVGTYYGLAMSTDNGTTFTNYATKYGLKSLEINDVYVDKSDDTKVYLATEAGLVYSINDKKGFDLINSNNGLQEDYAKAVVAKGKYIVVADIDGISISKDYGNTFSHQGIATLPSPNIRGLHLDNTSERLVVYTDSGLVYSDDWGDSWSGTIRDIGGGAGDDILDYYVHSNGNVYILSNAGLEFGPSPTNLTNMVSGITIDGDFKKVLVDSNDLIYVIDEDGIYKSTNTTGTGWDTKKTTFAHSSPQVITPLSNILDAAIDGNDRLYITSSDNGIYATVDGFATPATNYHINANTSLNNTQINGLAVDSTYNVLAATNNGLSFTGGANYNQFETNTSNFGASNALNDVFVNPSNKAYVAHNNGYSHGTDFSNLTLTTANLGSNLVTAIGGNNSGNLFVGTQAAGVLKSTDDGVTGTMLTTLTSPQLISNQINDIHYNQADGWMFVATNSGAMLTGNNFSTSGIIYSTPTLPSNVINTAINMGDDINYYSYYIGSNAGFTYNVYDYNASSWSGWATSTTGLENNNVLAIEVKDNGTDHVIFVGTEQEVGVSLDFGASFVSYTKENGLPGDRVNDIRVIGGGKIIVGTDKGLAISRDDFE